MNRNIWPYAIIGYFVVFISGMITWISFAVRNDDELVRPDYYEHEMKYQQQIDRVTRTRALSAGAAINYNATVQRVEVALPEEQFGSAEGTIHFYRPSNAGLDQKIPLRISKDGTQGIDISSFEGGLWKVRIDWSAAGEEYYLEKALVLPGG